MNILELEQEATHFDDVVDCVLYDENGEPEKDSTGVETTLFVLSVHSTQRKAFERKIAAKEKMLARRFGGANKIPADEQEAIGMERVASTLSGWKGLEAGVGVPFPFSHENAVSLLTKLRDKRPNQWSQVVTTIADHDSFFTKPSTA